MNCWKGWYKYILLLGALPNKIVAEEVATKTITTYSLVVKVQGLQGDSISIKEKISNERITSITSNGRYTFPNEVAEGDNFRIIISKQPKQPNQICEVVNGRGIMNRNRFKNKKVVITCRTPIEHVVIIGFDGMGGAYIEQGNSLNDREPILPTLDALLEESSWTFFAQDALPTSSSTNWCSMIGGNPPDVHGVLSNSWERGDSIIPPTLIAVTRANHPTSKIGLLYDWDNFARLVEDDVADVKYAPGDALETANAAIDFITDNKPLLTFVHIDICDLRGHGSGWGSSPYVDALEQSDTLLLSIIDTLKAEGMWNNTALLISSDHGGKNRNHGDDTFLERAIPFILRTPQTTGHKIEREVRIWDVAATAAALLGIDHPNFWVSSPVYEAIPFSPEYESMMTMESNYYKEIDEFQLIYDTKDMSITNELSIWRPNIPTGYVSLGDIAIPNQTPSLTCILDENNCTCAIDESDYRGIIAQTISGRTCQKWTDQVPHEHSRIPDNYPNTGLGDHNYCRNPDGEDGAWCYTTDEDVRWELCDVPSCPLLMTSTKVAVCTHDDSNCTCAIDESDYRGIIAQTISGRTCQKWTDQVPHEHSRIPGNYPNTGLGDHNYCRNPDGEDGAWCYTTDEDVRWELCDVPSCPLSNATTTVIPKDHPSVAYPIGFEKIWSSEGSSGSKQLTLWNPIPPPGGYSCPGQIAETNIEIVPALNSVACVLETFLIKIEQERSSFVVWNTDGSTNTMTGSIWQCMGNGDINNSSSKIIDPGLFVSRRIVNDPGHNDCRVLSKDKFQLCEDDPNFRFKDHETKDCSWVGAKANSRCKKQWKRKRIYTYCPITCNKC